MNEREQLTELQRTAPERIWLQISDDIEHRDSPFPHGEEVTWCQDSVMSCEVEYVRADLARVALAASPVPAGYKLVPVEPTQEMRVAGREAVKHMKTVIEHPRRLGSGVHLERRADAWDKASAAWTAMLAAAPVPTMLNGLTESETLATASVAGLSAPAKQAEAKCGQCGGTGVVDDGEAYCDEYGELFLNGPVKCVKDCPACGGTGRKPVPAPAPAQQAERECRHCGWLCRPNPAESQRWYPLTDPAPAPAPEQKAGFSVCPRHDFELAGANGCAQCNATAPSVEAQAVCRACNGTGETVTCCGRSVAGAEYMGSTEWVCCGNPDRDSCSQCTIKEPQR